MEEYNILAKENARMQLKVLSAIDRSDITGTSNDDFH